MAAEYVIDRGGEIFQIMFIIFHRTIGQTDIVLLHLIEIIFDRTTVEQEICEAQIFVNITFCGTVVPLDGEVMMIETAQIMDDAFGSLFQICQHRRDIYSDRFAGKSYLRYAAVFEQSCQWPVIGYPPGADMDDPPVVAAQIFQHIFYEEKKVAKIPTFREIGNDNVLYPQSEYYNEWIQLEVGKDCTFKLVLDYD